MVYFPCKMGTRCKKQDSQLGKFTSSFIFNKSNSTAAGAQISKGAADVATTMNTFTAMIAVINYPSDHWITLQFNSKKEILEVLDSMAPKNTMHRMEQIQKV